MTTFRIVEHLDVVEDGREAYRATQADQHAWDQARCPKPCKLTENHMLATMVASKLQLQWSPEQITAIECAAAGNNSRPVQFPALAPRLVPELVERGNLIGLGRRPFPITLLAFAINVLFLPLPCVVGGPSCHAVYLHRGAFVADIA